jgi:hypothetical protein
MYFSTILSNSFKIKNYVLPLFSFLYSILYYPGPILFCKFLSGSYFPAKLNIKYKRVFWRLFDRGFFRTILAESVEIFLNFYRYFLSNKMFDFVFVDWVFGKLISASSRNFSDDLVTFSLALPNPFYLQVYEYFVFFYWS